MDYGAVHTRVDVLGKGVLVDGILNLLGQVGQGFCASCIIRHVNMSVGMNRYRTVVAASHKRKYVCRT